MIGLSYLVALAVYLLISVAVVRGAIGYARKNNKSAKRWGWGAAFVMYSIVFWDWIPTVTVHQFYCAKDSGFWVYKTLDQWKAENPGVMETLVANKGDPSTSQGDMQNFIDTHFWNQRIISKFEKSGPFIYKVWRHEQTIIDAKTGEVLSRFVDFSTGNGHVGGEPELRFWLHSDGCVGSDEQARKYVAFVKQFKGTEK